MAEVVKRGEFSNRAYRFMIAGDQPTTDELMRMDQILRDNEHQFAKGYEEKYGRPLTPEGSGIGNYIGEFPKGIMRGAVGMMESGLLGAATVLPEDYENIAREYIRSGAYGMKPLADPGLDQTVSGKFGEALGSFGGLGLTALVSPLAAGAMAVGSGVGEASERARAAGATQEERGLAALLGAPIGALDILPIKFIKVLGKPATGAIMNRLSRAAAEGGVEAVQEAATQIAQNMVEKGIYNPDKGVFTDTGESAGYGFGVGALVQALMDMVPGRNRTPGAPQDALLLPPPFLALPAPTRETAAAPTPAPKAAPKVAPNVTGGVQVDPDIAEARAVYDERIGISEDGGASPDEAAAIAAESTIRYIDGLPDEAKAKLSSFRRIMQGQLDLSRAAQEAAKAAANEAEITEGGRFAPPEAYRDEVTPKSQMDLFEDTPQAPEAQKPTVTPVPEAKPVVTEPMAGEGSDVAAAAEPNAETVGTSAPGSEQGMGEVGGVDSNLQDTQAAAAPEQGGLGGNLSVPADTAGPEGAVPPPLTPEPGDAIAALERRLAEARDRAAKLRAAVHAGALRRVYTEAKLDPALTKKISNLETLANRQTKTVENLKAKLDAAKAQAARQKAVEAYNKALETQRKTQEELIAARDAADAALLASELSRSADTEIPLAGKNVKESYTAYKSALFDADTIARRLDREKARAAAEAERAAQPKTPEPEISEVKTPGMRGMAPEEKLAPGPVPSTYQTDKQKEQELQQWFARDFIRRTTEAYRKYTSGPDGINNPRHWAGIQDWTTVLDKSRISRLLRMPDKYQFTPEQAAARLYFSKTVRPRDAIDLAVDDLTVGYKIYESATGKGKKGVKNPSPETQLMQGTGTDAANLALKWMRENLAVETNYRIKALIEMDANSIKGQKAWVGVKDGKDRVMSAEDKAAARAAANDKAYNDAVLSGYVEETSSKMANDSGAALDQKMHYSVRAALANGDLKGALTALAETTQNKEVARLARLFADNAGTTRIEVLDRAVDPQRHADLLDGSPGIYWQSKTDPEKQNIIYLDAKTGLTNHVLMHEVAHAVTADFIVKNPNHKLVKQLDELRQTVIKDRLPFEELLRVKRGYGVSPDFYGLTNVKEFVAEVFGRITLDPNENGLLQVMRRQSYLDSYMVTDTREAAVDIPLLKRFAEIVNNIFRAIAGKPPVYLPRTKTVSDTRTTNMHEYAVRLAEQLISPAQNVLPNRVLEDTIGNPLLAKNVINMSVKNAPTWGADGMARMWNFLRSNTPEGPRSLVMGAMLFDSIADMARKYMPSVDLIKTEDQERRGTTDRLHKLSRPTANDLAKVAASDPEGFKELSAIEFESSFTGVDPLKPSSTYANDKEKLDTWNKLNRQLNKIDNTGEMRKLFGQTKNLYAAMRKEFEATLLQNAKDITGDEKLARTLRERLLEKMFKDGVIDPYFAFMRSGDFWVSYTASDRIGPPVAKDAAGNDLYPTTQFVHAFDSPKARDAFIKELSAAKDKNGKPVASDITTFMRSDARVPGNTPSLQYVQGAMQIVKNIVGNVNERNAAVQALQDLFITLTPANSALRSYKARKDGGVRGGVRGAIGDITEIGVLQRPKDIVRAIDNKVTNLAYQIANMRHGGNIVRASAQIQTEFETSMRALSMNTPEQRALVSLHKEVMKRAAFARAPNISRGWYHARGVTFAMTLGANISSTIGAMFQLPMVVMPHLTGRYKSLPKVAAAMRRASILAGSAGKSFRTISPTAKEGVMEQRTLEDLENFGSLENYYEVNKAGDFVLRTDRKIPDNFRKDLEELAPLAKLMAQRGILAHTPQQTEMIDASDLMSRVYKWMGMPMHFAERYTRQTTAIATYLLERDAIRAKNNGKFTQTDAYNTALHTIDTTELTNGGVGAATNARYAHTGLGSVIFLYKRFGLTMARYIIQSVKKSLRKIDPKMNADEIAYAKEERAIARYQLAGMLGITALFSGVQGLPFFSELMTLFNALFTDDEEDDFEAMLQKFAGEPFYHGLLNYVTGAEIASRISLSGLLFREPRINKDQSALYDLVDIFGGPAVGVFMNFERGTQLIGEGELYRGIEAMLPAAIRNAMKAGRYAAEGGATTMRGDTVVPLSYTDIAFQLIGYTPDAYARMQEATSREKRKTEAVASRKRKLLSRLNIAKLEYDFEEVNDLLEEIQQYNAEHPDNPITTTSMKQSMAQFRRTSADMIGGVSFPKNQRPGVVESLSEYSPSTFE